MTQTNPPLADLLRTAHTWLDIAQDKNRGWGGMPSIPIGMVAALVQALEAQTPQLTQADIDLIVEGIEHFCIGPEDNPEVQAIWQPYIDKLRGVTPVEALEAKPEPARYFDKICADCSANAEVRDSLQNQLQAADARLAELERQLTEAQLVNNRLRVSWNEDVGEARAGMELARKALTAAQAERDEFKNLSEIAAAVGVKQCDDMEALSAQLQQLREAHERLRMGLEQLPEHISVLHSDTDSALFNGVWTEMQQRDGTSVRACDDRWVRASDLQAALTPASPAKEGTTT